MPLMKVVECVWSGGAGGAGLTKFYFEDATSSAALSAAVGAFWTAIADSLPAGIKVTTPGGGDVIDSATGTLTGAWSGGSSSQQNGIGGTAYSAASGACITWLTSTVVDGRVVKGRTFIVPLQSNQYDDTGTLQGATLTRLENAADALWDTLGGMIIWHRPTTPGGSDGVPAPVVGKIVRDKVAILTSRRD